MVFGGTSSKLDFTARDVGMVVVDVALAMAIKDMLIKQGVIPADIMKLQHGKYCDATGWRPRQRPRVLRIELSLLHVEELWRQRGGQASR